MEEADETGKREKEKKYRKRKKKKLENKRILAISTSATLVMLRDSGAILNDMAAEFPLT